ncbi:hypothetical protein FLONG3_8773 [Fusarium longipes]|uniref:Zn(2)-C6 fungal-type domain-containing protein n=1 Tax=Fusarium longipes TaxID=694270 RepID=A0A395S2U6_9HYPO|nr:hypothetical protein FLONG3_8773 [Fusarium longipes]
MPANLPHESSVSTFRINLPYQSSARNHEANRSTFTPRHLINNTPLARATGSDFGIHTGASTFLYCVHVEGISLRTVITGMDSSRSLREIKACFGCARSKRSCNKQMPSCQRCVERAIRCHYPTTRRYLRSKPAINIQSQRLGQARLQVSARQTEHPQIPAYNFVSDLPNQDSPITNHVTYKPWFVGLNTWTIENKGMATCHFNSGSSYGSSQLEDWTNSLRQWLRQWVDEGSNPFIHKRLYYDTGLPLCLEDAWTTLTAYFSKTALNRHLVVQIIEHRIDALLQSQPHDDTPFMGVSSLQTIQHLARVQALFIYQYLLVCDGTIRHRAMAERYIPTLMQWCDYAWQSATFDSFLNEQFLTTMDPNEPDAVAETLASNHWKAWILSESLRRTWIICTSTVAAYLRERDGWNECAGEVRYTACQGLWDASSSAMWLELSSKQDPLFVRSLHVDELLIKGTPDEMDSFSAALILLLVGRDKMESCGYK